MISELDEGQAKPSQRLARGVLIAIEGIDGAGKTTQARAIAEGIQRRWGFPVISTKEPTDGVWGRKIRESARSGRLPPEEEFRFFLEDRRDHVTSLIEPSLARGEVVIVDRYYLSSAAYQGARGLSQQAILEANEKFSPRPDVVFLLEIPVEDAAKRILRREGDEGNLFEERDYLERCAAGFEELVETRDFFKTLDGMGSREEITNAALGHLVSLGLFVS